MHKSERSQDQSVPSQEYPASAAREASRMIAPIAVTPIENWHPTTTVSETASDLRAAWAGSTPAIRFFTMGAAIAALASSAAVDVPTGSGLAIAILTAAALVDWHQRRVPDALTLTAATAFIGAALLETRASVSPLGVGLGIAVFAGPLLVMHLISPQAMGYGDVKLAVVLGMAVGALHWSLAAWALMAAAALTAVAGLSRGQATVPFGPGLVAGALGAVMAVALFDVDGLGF